MRKFVIGLIMVLGILIPKPAVAQNTDSLAIILGLQARVDSLTKILKAQEKGQFEPFTLENLDVLDTIKQGRDELFFTLEGDVVLSDTAARKITNSVKAGALTKKTEGEDKIIIHFSDRGTFQKKGTDKKKGNYVELLFSWGIDGAGTPVYLKFYETPSPYADPKAKTKTSEPGEVWYALENNSKVSHMGSTFELNFQGKNYLLLKKATENTRSKISD